MDIGKISSTGLFEDEDDEEDEKLSYGTGHGLDPSDEKIEKARSRKAEHVYEVFVRPAIDDLDEEFSGEDVLEVLRPPYSEDEIEMALEYGINEGDIHYEEDGDFYRWDP